MNHLNCFSRGSQGIIVFVVRRVLDCRAADSAANYYEIFKEGKECNNQTESKPAMDRQIRGNPFILEDKNGGEDEKGKRGRDSTGDRPATMDPEVEPTNKNQ